MECCLTPFTDLSLFICNTTCLVYACFAMGEMIGNFIMLTPNRFFPVNRNFELYFPICSLSQHFGLYISWNTKDQHVSLYGQGCWMGCINLRLSHLKSL